MRTLRLSLVGAVILGLLVSLSITVVAQDEEPGPMAPAYFTYTLEPVGVFPVEGDENVVRDHRETDAVEATDPRASGLLTTIGNWNEVAHEGSGFMTAATSVRLANDGGAWSGTGRGTITNTGGGRSLMTGLSMLTGEDGYEGLTLMMNQYWEPDTATFWGVILPSDQVPPVPDPVEPSAE
jgi:hypothetical protein